MFIAPQYDKPVAKGGVIYLARWSREAPVFALNGVFSFTIIHEQKFKKKIKN
jgi:hypothetical protein